MKESLEGKKSKKNKKKKKPENESLEKGPATSSEENDEGSDDSDTPGSSTYSAVEMYSQNLKDREEFSTTINVIVNNRPVTLEGKGSYVFVDIFDFYEFDLQTVKGEKLIMKINGEPAEHFSPVKEADKLEIFWKK